MTGWDLGGREQCFIVYAVAIKLSDVILYNFFSITNIPNVTRIKNLSIQAT